MSVLIFFVSLPVLYVAVYLSVLTMRSGQPPVIQNSAERSRKFIVLVPAHNESDVIQRTVKSIRSLDWPEAPFRNMVIADNCQDDTAAMARDAGAEVLERHDPDHRGKGYALEFAFNKIIDENWADAVVVVDADTVVSRNLLAAFDARLQAGAQACQAFYGVLNAEASWRTRLMAIALGVFHRLRGRGRESFGFSCGLRGNGMCFTVETLQKVPHQAFSIVEDLEYGVQLGKAGIRVWYVDEANVLGEMVSGEKASRTQRQRWEGGRAQMRKQYGWPLLRAAFRQRSFLLFDLSMDVLVPPLGSIALACAALSVAGVVLASFSLIGTAMAIWSLLPTILLVVHVMRGVALSGLGSQGWLTLAMAPAYIIWKLALKLRAKGPGNNWVRTQREGSGRSQD